MEFFLSEGRIESTSAFSFELDLSVMVVPFRSNSGFKI
jgi:hypothetical protein